MKNNSLTAREGMKRPVGTLIPKVNTVMMALRMRVTASIHIAREIPEPAG